MEITNPSLGLVVMLCTLLWTLFTYFSESKKYQNELSSDFTNRLQEIDKLVIEFPIVQQYLSLTANMEEDYFRKKERLDEEVFFKAKGVVYMYLNLFEDILCISKELKSSVFSSRHRKVLEMDDWERYFKRKFSHPIFRSILNTEMESFGASLREFWYENRNSLPVSDSHSW